MSRQLRTYYERLKDKGYVQGTITKRQVYSDVTIYLSPTGSELGDGSRDRPFKSIGQACKVLGDYEPNYNDLYIRFLPGTYSWTDSDDVKLSNLKGWNQVYVISDTDNADDVVINSSFEGFFVSQNIVTNIHIYSLTINATAAGACVFVSDGNLVSAIGIGRSGKTTKFGTGKSVASVYGCRVNAYGTWVITGDKDTLVLGGRGGYFYAVWTAIQINCDMSIASNSAFIELGTGSSAFLYGPIQVGEGFSLTGTDWLLLREGTQLTTYTQFTNTIPEGMGVDVRGSCIVNGMTGNSSKTVAQLEAEPTAAIGMTAWCSNEVGGACLVVYDGTNWVRVNNGNTISAT